MTSIFQPLQPPNDVLVSLLELLKKYRQTPKTIEEPHFQRGFVWSSPKIQEWADSIKAQQAVGTIVTYQVTTEETPNGYVIYLNDGKQRLNATARILKSPEEYGMVSTAQAKAYIDAFKINVQHRHYKSHDEALKAFQNLNIGTPANPGEFYKGELTRHANGTRLYNWLSSVVETTGKDISGTKNNASNDRVNVLRRDALALFYQFVSPQDHVTFWKVATSKIKPGDQQPIERILGNYLRSTLWEDIESQVKVFHQYIEKQTRTVAQIASKIRPREQLSDTAYRHFLHAAIWGMKAGYSQDVFFLPYVETVLRNSPSSSGTIGTTVYHPDRHGNPHHTTISLQDLTKIWGICDAFNIKVAPHRKRTAASREKEPTRD